MNHPDAARRSFSAQGRARGRRGRYGTKAVPFVSGCLLRLSPFASFFVPHLRSRRSNPNSRRPSSAGGTNCFRKHHRTAREECGSELRDGYGEVSQQRGKDGLVRFAVITAPAAVPSSHLQRSDSPGLSRRVVDSGAGYAPNRGQNPGRCVKRSRDRRSRY